MPQFIPVPTGINREFCRGQLQNHALPTALCALGDASNPEQILTIDFPNGRSHALPWVDIGSYAEDRAHSTPGYVLHRLRTRLGIIVAKSGLDVPGLMYEDDTRIGNMGVQQFPNAHYRTLFPVTGLFRKLNRLNDPLRPQQQVVRPLDEVRQKLAEAAATADGYRDMSVLSLAVLDLYEASQAAKTA